ncbi:hypothetical protein OSF78_000960 [Salmonella enterica subsp. enterica serovar Mbandaka]|nr:hypothetical protein [Salmonella enterica subsp. enterica serovar Mbandaka]
MTNPTLVPQSDEYQQIHDGIIRLVDTARTETVRSINAIMTATYWEIGRRIVEFEQGGEARAAYGTQLIERLSVDLSQRYKRGFSTRNLWQIRTFYLCFQHIEDSADTVCGIFKSHTARQNIPSSLVSLCASAVGER